MRAGRRHLERPRPHIESHSAAAHKMKLDCTSASTANRNLRRGTSGRSCGRAIPKNLFGIARSCPNEGSSYSIPPGCADYAFMAWCRSTEGKRSASLSSSTLADRSGLDAVVSFSQHMRHTSHAPTAWHCSRLLHPSPSQPHGAATLWCRRILATNIMPCSVRFSHS